MSYDDDDDDDDDDIMLNKLLVLSAKQWLSVCANIVVDKCYGTKIKYKTRKLPVRVNSASTHF